MSDQSATQHTPSAVTDAMALAAINACCIPFFGNTSAYKAPETLDEWKEAIAAALAMSAQQGVELKPCPFCGGEAEMESTTDADEGCNCVRCDSCDFDLMGGPVGIGWWPTSEAAAATWNRRAELIERSEREGVPAFDMLAHLRRQREWSERTFGPGVRTAGVVDHIRKELREIETQPDDLYEWIDVVILALDGAWRSGGSPQGIVDAIVAKQTKNEGRTWPDWRTVPADKAIEHDRSHDVTPTVPSKNDTDRREFLGKLVRMEWIAWAREQSSPKPSWMQTWDELTEPEREVDRRIGERIYDLAIGGLYTPPAPSGNVVAGENDGFSRISPSDLAEWLHKELVALSPADYGNRARLTSDLSVLFGMARPLFIAASAQPPVAPAPRNHAPLPWRSVPWHIEEGPSAVRDANGDVVCTTSSDECSAFIATTANATTASAQPKQESNDD